MTKTCLRFIVLSLLMSCGSNAAESGVQGDAGPGLVAETDAKLLRIEAFTTPDQPPTRGLSTVTLRITNATTGEPQDGLSINAVPWMPAHGHGTSIEPVVETLDAGTYEISRVNMYMGGRWDLRIALSGTINDNVTLHYAIP